MICGVGIDLCDIERMKKAAAQKGFCERVFSPEEIEYANSKAEPAAHFASAFAAREALAKAGGWGLGALGLGFCSISRTETGPKFIFSEDFSVRLKKAGVSNVFLSLTHDGGAAAAVVVLERDK